MNIGTVIDSVRRVGVLNLPILVYDRHIRRGSLSGLIVSELAHSQGLEVGGPSARFMDSGRIPLYREVAAIDNVNFARDTTWENELEEGGSFRPQGHPLGTQYVAEGGALPFEGGKYDFVASSHALEHMANPIAAIREWHRVTSDEGRLLIVLPHGEATFDRRRPVTTFAHLQADFVNDVGEDDRTHFSEIVSLHDFSRDPGKSPNQLARQLERNAEVREAHHHVFDIPLACQLLAESGWQPIFAEGRRPWDIIVLAKKSEAPDDTPLRPIRSSFKSDRGPKVRSNWAGAGR